MPRVFVNQLADGSPVDEVFLLADRQLRANRHAETYLLAQLRGHVPRQLSGERTRHASKRLTKPG